MMILGLFYSKRIIYKLLSMEMIIYVFHKSVCVKIKLVNFYFTCLSFIVHKIQ